ncbi:DNA-binding transcriptional LysR family regulator [Xanthomonas campestris]|uniref:LysR substrate-binding domain-containing protein n=1 Tax=Xanthomonas sp. CFBP 8151 TaxID=3035310 RepID=UPI00141BEF5D|nr:LysR substrate-binding domain-containing protein [Xanthomonas sp. CFBP 8151]NIJ75514.1 DNA-binding transcriptional LysR family regulator [Xanthomonas sp. CFBP 8151]
MRASSRPPVLKLGVSPGVPSPRLAALLALHRAEEPETPIRMQEASPDDLVEGVQDGRYDMGMILAGITAPAIGKPLWRDELAVAVPVRSTLLCHAAIPVTALLSYSLFPSSPQASEVLFGHEPPALCRITSHELMTVLVAAGYGVGIAPRSRIVQLRGLGVVMRPLAGGTCWIGTQLFRSELGDSPAIERFVDRASKVAGDIGLDRHR